MAAWWLISHNSAHWGFEKCLKILPESQTCPTRRNVTARLGLSDAGTASRNSGMCHRKTLWMAPSPGRTRQQFEKTSGRAWPSLWLQVSPPSDLDGNEKCAGVNILWGCPQDLHTLLLHKIFRSLYLRYSLICCRTNLK